MRGMETTTQQRIEKRLMPRYGVMLNLDEIETAILGLERARDADLMSPVSRRDIARALDELYKHHANAKSDARDLAVQ